MKRIIVIVVMIVVAISSIFIMDNIDTKASSKTYKKKSKINKTIKTDYKYITEENDNIEELLKEKEVVNPSINYVYEEAKEIKEEKEEIIKNGFIEENNNIYYYENNKYVTGEKMIDNDTFYFNEKGELQRNIFIDKKYFGEEGKLVLGFYSIDNKDYYFTNEGYLVGNKEIENEVYYFDENGVMQKDVMIENCYYDETGKLYTGFKDIDGNTFYFSRDGIAKGIKEIDNKKYYFDEDGHLIRNSFYDKYYLDENGIIVTGNREIGGRIYVFDDEGILQNGFQEIDGNIYFLDENLNRLTGLQLIDNIRYYFDFETGVLIKKDVKSVIDISSWQGDIDFEKVKNSNLVDKVIVRIGYGTTNKDDPVIDNKFEYNIKELNRVGIPYELYIFGYAQNEDAAKLEADFVINILNKYNISKDTFIWYDAELSEFEGKKYTKTMYKKVINKFISILNDNNINNVGVYSYLYMFNKGSLTSLQKRIPKWVAQYYKRCEYEEDYKGWQYTSNGTIPGINGRVDMNIFY